MLLIPPHLEKISKSTSQNDNPGWLFDKGQHGIFKRKQTHRYHSYREHTV